MGRFREGRWQVTWNKGTGDVRVYTIFDSGRVRERMANGATEFITPEAAVVKLDDLIGFEERWLKAHPNVELYTKIHETRLQQYKVYKEFIMMKNPNSFKH